MEKDLDTIEYFNPQKTIIIYQNYKLHFNKINKNGTKRWRCEACKGITITSDKNDSIIRGPNVDAKHNAMKCLKMSPVQIICQKEYEILKHKSKNDASFKFAQCYRGVLQSLQAEHDPKLVAEYFPKEESARVTCSSSNKSTRDPSTTYDFEIMDDHKYLTINQEKQLFLRFDNQNKQGKRILIFVKFYKSQTNTILTVHLKMQLKCSIKY